jgi:hypothetical protein
MYTSIKTAVKGSTPVSRCNKTRLFYICCYAQYNKKNKMKIDKFLQTKREIEQYYKIVTIDERLKGFYKDKSGNIYGFYKRCKYCDAGFDGNCGTRLNCPCMGNQYLESKY